MLFTIEAGYGRCFGRSNIPLLHRRGIQTDHPPPLSAHVEFAKVTPSLQEGYSLLLVDLPEHSASNDIPFSIPTAAGQLQQLIHDQVPNHRVHVVGVSLGGCFGLGLARQHPHRMKSLFATGSVPYREVRRFIAEHTQLLYCIIVIQFLLMRILPAWVRKYFEQLKDTQSFCRSYDRI